MLEKIIESLTQIKSTLWDYHLKERIELKNVINTLKEINNKQNTFIIKTFSEDDLYYIIPESLEEQFDEFEERLEKINSTDNEYSSELVEQEIELYEEFSGIFDEYSYENLSTIKIKGVIERE